jgi:ligand-binding SRPBCC domain-containing protein
MPFVAARSAGVINGLPIRRGGKMTGKTHTLTFVQQVPRGLPEVFAFFSRAENLEAITPSWLHFKVLAITPEPIRQGTLISYSLRLHGVPLRWTSRIAEWDPPRRFVDLQLRGPYKLWRHEHHFEARDGGTLITDTVSLALPLGVLGQIAYRVRVHAQVNEIFAFRESKIRALFS